MKKMRACCVYSLRCIQVEREEGDWSLNSFSEASAHAMWHPPSLPLSCLHPLFYHCLLHSFHTTHLHNRPSLSSLNKRIAVRGMASEKEIAARIKSTTGINKITKTMKMVAASKMRGDEDRLKAGRPFQKWVDGFTPKPVLLEDFAKDIESLPQSNLLVVVTTDRGLCGGVNSSLARVLKNMVPALDKAKKDVQLFIIGDKGRATMGRPLGEFITQINSDSATPYNFSLAAALAQDVSQIKADAVHVVFNRFRSAIAYEATVKTMYPPAALTGEPYVEYEFEPDTKTEVLDDMYEMAIATTVFTSMLESAAAEQSSRMNAMENASKNGEDLIKELSIQYNRARQSRITTELVEIISGASALEAAR